MKTIEEISFKVEETKCTFKIYMYEETTIKQIKQPVERNEITQTMGYKYINTKVKITKYALHQILEFEKEIHDVLICETEMYSIILTILKEKLTDYVKSIERAQYPRL